MIDTHCHLTFDHYEGRVEQVVREAREHGVRGLITISTTSQDCAKSLAIAKRFDNVWCSAGVHPLHSDEPCDWNEVRAVGEDPKCVAWGELGLDNHYSNPPRDVQDRVLSAQLAHLERWTNEGLAKPIVVHCREAFDDLLGFFRDAPFDPSRYVFHCFTGGPDDARKVLDFGAWISFTGVVTFANAREVAEAAKLVPLDRMMVETDAPFLSPEPVRKVRPNEPKYVMHVANFIADLRNVDRAEFEQQMDANAGRFFGIEL
jgi:TatD DNase family protein